MDMNGSRRSRDYQIAEFGILPKCKKAWLDNPQFPYRTSIPFNSSSARHPRRRMLPQTPPPVRRGQGVTMCRGRAEDELKGIDVLYGNW